MFPYWLTVLVEGDYRRVCLISEPSFFDLCQFARLFECAKSRVYAVNKFVVFVKQQAEIVCGYRITQRKLSDNFLTFNFDSADIERCWQVNNNCINLFCFECRFSAGVVVINKRLIGWLDYINDEIKTGGA